MVSAREASAPSGLNAYGNRELAGVVGEVVVVGAEVAAR